MSKAFGWKIRQARTQKGMNACDIAGMIGVSKQAYSAYENGTREPNMRRLRMISEILEVSADDLITDDVFEDDGLMVKINMHGNPMPVKHGDWIDLCTAEDVSMKKGEIRVISLGISVELPEGYYAKVLSRSSSPNRWGIIQANSVGIIDNEYSGDGDIWGFVAYAVRDTEIPKGTRIAQFCVVKQEVEIKLVEVERLGNPDRGGFGSTGK